MALCVSFSLLSFSVGVVVRLPLSSLLSTFQAAAVLASIPDPILGGILAMGMSSGALKKRRRQSALKKETKVEKGGAFYAKA